MTNKELEKIYTNLNRLYFNNEVKIKSISFLPPRNIKYKNIKSLTLGAFEITRNKNGKFDARDGNNVIRLHHVMKKVGKKNHEALENLLAHEMCHYFAPNHGKEFKRQMKKYKLIKELKNILKDEGKYITIQCA